MLSRAVLLFALVLVQSEAQNDQNFNWDGPVDLWLDSQVRLLAVANERSIAVGDIDEDFSTRLGNFATLRGRFVATEGTLSDITTLRRRTRVTAEKTGKVTKLTTKLGWDVLILKFARYSLKMSPFAVSGTLEGNIKLNSVEITLAFEDVDGECVTTLDRFKIVELDDFELKVSGLGPLNFAAASIGQDVALKHKPIIIANTEQKLKAFMSRGLVDYHCEEHASLLGVPLN